MSVDVIDYTAAVAEYVLTKEHTAVGKIPVVRPGSRLPFCFDLAGFAQAVLADARFEEKDIQPEILGSDGWCHGAMPEHLGTNLIANWRDSSFFRELARNFFLSYPSAKIFPFHVVWFRPGTADLQVAWPLFKGLYNLDEHSCTCCLPGETALHNIIWLYRFLTEAHMLGTRESHAFA